MSPEPVTVSGEGLRHGGVFAQHVGMVKLEACCGDDRVFICCRLIEVRIDGTRIGALTGQETPGGGAGELIGEEEVELIECGDAVEEDAEAGAGLRMEDGDGEIVGDVEQVMEFGAAGMIGRELVEEREQFGSRAGGVADLGIGGAAGEGVVEEFVEAGPGGGGIGQTLGGGEGVAFGGLRRARGLAFALGGVGEEEGGRYAPAVGAAFDGVAGVAECACGFERGDEPSEEVERRECGIGLNRESVRGAASAGSKR